MRLLVYGMQSSGATAFTLFLAQRPDCLALVDVLNNFAAPRIDTDMDMVAKVVVTTAYPLAVHMERFRPDRTILLLRDPRANYLSLRDKHYRNYSGLIDEKFLLLDQIFAERHKFDAVVHFEDFVDGSSSVLESVNGLGWPVSEECRTYRRRHDELLQALWQHVPDLFQTMEMAFGGVHGREVDQHFRDKYDHGGADAELVENRLKDLCPRLLDHYRNRR